MTRKQKTLTTLFAFILVLSVIAVTYAYFNASVIKDTSLVTKTTTQVANLTMTTIKSTVGDPVYPGWVGYQGIEVSASGSGSTIYDLTLNITGGTNILGDVTIEVCKIEDTTTALAANQITFTAATPQVNAAGTEYYMSGGVVTLPSGCTSVIATSTLASKAPSVKISSSLGKELDAGYKDRYYVKILYVNNPSAAQTAGETFTIAPSLSVKAEEDTPVITCETIADSGNYVACDASNMFVGERVKIGNDANAQYFRYIRTTTTDTNTQKNECGTTSSTACADTAASTVGIPSPSSGTGPVMRLLAEYNLVATGSTIASTALQDITTNKNGIGFDDTSSQYNRPSKLKGYIDNYASLLSTTYGINSLSGSVITQAEILSLCGIASGYCDNTYPWVYQTAYWSGSNPNGITSVKAFIGGNVVGNLYYSGADGTCGARPIIQVPTSLFS